MATLQRSAKSFRRQGSSGLVWDDSLLSDPFCQGAKNDSCDLKELRPCQSAKAMLVGMDYSSRQNNTTAGTSPSQRAYTRSLSAVFSRQHLVKKLKMRKAPDP